jgi:hypothetical protein
LINAGTLRCGLISGCGSRAARIILTSMNRFRLRPSARLCGSRLSRGRGHCRAMAITGKSRCRWHGGRSTGPKTADGKARSVAAMVAGRQAWVERMHMAKAVGLIDRFPGGWPKGMPRNADRLIARARAAIAEYRRWLTG